MVLNKYEVKDKVLPPIQDAKNKPPSLCAEDSFYSVLRLKVAKYLKRVGGPGPDEKCLQLFWVSF